jgi:predicted ATP-grasp superfamily ATP-dependent carboligase
MRKKRSKMEYKLIQDDVFNHKDCYYAHCISRDYALGAGIAVEFDKRYDMRNRLLKLAEEKTETLDEKCIEVENVFNLITKEKYWEKPSYNSLEESLLEMKEKLSKNKNIKKLVMPKIGCGLDRLSWDKVEPMVQEIFKDLDIEIVVCYL